MRQSRLAALAAVFVFASLPASVRAVQYKASVFATSATPFSINNFGQASGSWGAGVAIWNLNTGSVVTTVTEGYGQSMNDAGQVIISSSATQIYISSRWDGTNPPQPLPANGGGYCNAQGINSSGQVAGYFRTATAYYHACLWDANDQMTVIDGADRSSFAYGLNDSGAVVGSYQGAGGGSQAFVWDATNGMRTLRTLGGWSGRAADINNSGVAVGYSVYGSAWCATLWDTAGNPTNLGPSDGRQSYAHAINDSGSVIGRVQNELDSYTYDPVVWDRNGTMVKLPTLLGYQSWTAVAINDAGWIVGFAQTGADGGYRSDAVLWTPVPEPASAVGLLSCLAGLGMACIRRRTHRR